MSHLYEIGVQISGYTYSNRQAIKQTLKDWDLYSPKPFFHERTGKYRREQGTYIQSVSEMSIGGNPADMVRKWLRALWKANAGFCEIEIEVKDLEACPFETYFGDEEAWDEEQGEQP